VLPHGVEVPGHDHRPPLGHLPRSGLPERGDLLLPRRHPVLRAGHVRRHQHHRAALHLQSHRRHRGVRHLRHRHARVHCRAARGQVVHREEHPVRVPVQHSRLIQVLPHPLRGAHDHDDAGPPLPQHPHQVLAILRIAARVQREQRGPHRAEGQRPGWHVPGGPGELQRKPRNSHERHQLPPATPGRQEQ